MPKWKQWILRNVIGEFEARNVDMRTYRSDRFGYVLVKPGKPGKATTAQINSESVSDPWAREKYYG